MQAAGRAPWTDAPGTGSRNVIGCSLAFDDAAQVNLEITAASAGRARNAIKRPIGARGK